MTLSERLQDAVDLSDHVSLGPASAQLVLGLIAKLQDARLELQVCPRTFVSGERYSPSGILDRIDRVLASVQ